MPRIKTHKATAKRFRVSGGRARKLIHRSATQGHFNAREDGSTVRAKRRDMQVSKAMRRKVSAMMPYAFARKTS